MDKALQELVRQRAQNRCEYCQFPLPQFHFEHIIARKHGGSTTQDNLALACVRCNFHKGANLSGIDPQTGTVVSLFHPRRDVWIEHFFWQGPRLVGITPSGRATIVVLEINHPLRVIARERLISEGRLHPRQG
jgi:HNH endonuclease